MSSVDQTVYADTKKQVLQHLRARRSVFITGAAGTGKSELLRHLFKSLKAIYPRRYSVRLGAPTGIAAWHLSNDLEIPRTVHSLIGGGALNSDPPVWWARVQRGNKRLAKTIRARWCAVRYLIIDEVSMLDIHTWARLDWVARVVRETDELFGGIVLVLVGDFHQLPPVYKDGEPETPYIFQTTLWRRLRPIPILLEYNFRQLEDPEFATFLTHLRTGEITGSDWRLLRRAVARYLHANQSLTTLLQSAGGSVVGDEPPRDRIVTAAAAGPVATTDAADDVTGKKRPRGVEPGPRAKRARMQPSSKAPASIAAAPRAAATEIRHLFRPLFTTHRADVARRNTASLQRLASLRGMAPRHYKATWSDPAMAPRFGHVRAPADLALIVGAPVMLVENVDGSAGLVNGRVGHVLQMHPTKVDVRWVDDGQDTTVLKHVDRRRIDGVYQWRSQIPLQLIFAFTVHKVQGQTVHGGADLQLDGSWEKGQVRTGARAAETSDITHGPPGLHCVCTLPACERHGTHVTATAHPAAAGSSGDRFLSGATGGARVM